MLIGAPTTLTGFCCLCYTLMKKRPVNPLHTVFSSDGLYVWSVVEKDNKCSLNTLLNSMLHVWPCTAFQMFKPGFCVYVLHSCCVLLLAEGAYWTDLQIDKIDGDFIPSDRPMMLGITTRFLVVNVCSALTSCPAISARLLRGVCRLDRLYNPKPYYSTFTNHA